MNIITASTKEDYAAAGQLFQEYQEFLGLNLAFQSFEEELQQLPEMYGAPNGALLLAKEDNAYAGCVAVRNKGEGICEMKRLYVPDAYGGKGLGRKLTVAIIDKAIELGYTEMVLDTLQRLQPAIALYKSLGFEQTGAYYHNPLEGVVYMRKQLGNSK